MQRDTGTKTQSLKKLTIDSWVATNNCYSEFNTYISFLLPTLSLFRLTIKNIVFLYGVRLCVWSFSV